MSEDKQEEKRIQQTVAVEDAGTCSKLLKVEVDAAATAEAFEKCLNQMQKLAHIPGFRPGRVPRAMIEKRFAKDIAAEVQRQTIPRSFRQAVTDHKLRVVIMPEVENVEYTKGQPLRYQAKLEVAPEFVLPTYKGIPVKQPSSEVTDEDFDRTLDALRDQRAQFSDVTGRALQMGDMGVIRYSAVVEGHPIQEVAPRAGLPEAEKDFWLLLDERAMAPGFCQQLVGASPGDRRQVLVDYPADFFVPELAGKKATFFVEVRGIKQKVLPPLDDALAQSFKETSLDSLKTKLRADIATQKKAHAAASVHNQIAEHLLRSTQFELPPQLLAHETREVVYDVVREQMGRGATQETIESNQDKILGLASRSAADRMRVKFILARIAEEEKIKVEKKEVDQQVEQMAKRYQIALTKLRAQLEERGGLLEIEEQLVRGKTLEFLAANAKVQPA
jgi:trigger factor